MTFMDDPSRNIKVILIIRRVDASSVFGEMEVDPYQGPMVTRRFRGTLNGNELWIGRWQLTVSRRRMTGHKLRQQIGQPW